jgi:tetratricopeptide (TPR) repeat protein
VKIRKQINSEFEDAPDRIKIFFVYENGTNSVYANFSHDNTVDSTIIEQIKQAKRDVNEILAKRTKSITPNDHVISHINKQKAEESKLLKSKESTKNIISLHFCYTGLSETAYSYRNNSVYLDMCIEYCKKDIELFPKFKNAWIKNENASQKKLSKAFPDYIPRKIELPFITSFRRLAIVYEQQGNIEGAIDICEQAIAYGLRDSTKIGYEGRLEKLKRKLK